ncbi:uncharacterized mitochondrial protein-like protein [Tanacetum coccineum]
MERLKGTRQDSLQRLKHNGKRVDYHEQFCSSANTCTVRKICGCGNKDRLVITSLICFFMHGDWKEKSRMKIPQGFLKEGETRVCRLLAKTSDGLVISQRKYTLDILKDSGMVGCRPSAFPFEQGTKLDKGEKEARVDATQYRRLVGRIFACDGPSNLTAYCDSDWLGCPFTRRLRMGYLLILGGGPISWRTKKQSVVSRSSAEAEYRAMASTVGEILWVRWLLKDLQVDITTPTPLFCDNQAARHIANTHALVHVGLVVKGEEGALSMTTRSKSGNASKGLPVNYCSGFRSLNTPPAYDVDGVSRQNFSFVVDAKECGFEPSDTSRTDRSVFKNIETGIAALHGGKRPRISQGSYLTLGWRSIYLVVWV